MDFSYINTSNPYAVMVAVAITVFALFIFVQRKFVVYLERTSIRTKNKIDDIVVAILKDIQSKLYWILVIYIGLKVFELPQTAHAVISGILLAGVLYLSVRSINVAIEIGLASPAANPTETAARHLLAKLAKGSIWIVALLLLLSNLGINVTSLIAGLGVGGIAVAFALQNILSDLFSSFTIYFDKPFEIGDFIITNDKMGTVTKIGIKSTRLTALQGEEIIISNKELTSMSIQNFKRMRERRVVMNFGITYETPRATVAKLPNKIRVAVEKLPDIRVDRIHFSGFGDSSLNFELVYYVVSADYTEYMDRQQLIGLTLLKLFESEKVSFAYPTRTIHTVQAPPTL